MPPTPIQVQIDALKDQMEALRDQASALERRQDVADLMRVDTHKMVSELHLALMTPQLGQGTKSMLERIADVTVAVETGDRAAETLVKWLKRLTVVGAFLVAIGAYIAKVETWKGPTP
jgi:hypothetical protein